MTTHTLSMRYSPRAGRPTAAWYVPSADPAVWLDEVTTWDTPQPHIQLLPVPQSLSDRQPQGTLVITSAAPPSNVSKSCIPYGLHADCLYLPTEAQLEPDVSPTELRALLSDRNHYIWHPTGGLIAVEPDDILRIADLICIGPASPERWDAAQPGVTLARRLTSLVPQQTLTIEQIMQDGQDDIGAESDEISELPPSPAEPKPGVMGSAARGAMRMAAGITHWFTQRAPVGGSEPTWVNRLEQWAAKHLERLDNALSAERNKEIARLMHLLETDPDKGLRYALPFGGDAARGRANPGSRLGERDTNFSLGRLGGGGAADYWDLSADYQYQLTARYRELANREIRLGRHRRAAYIFAELLGDYDAAAGALVEGRHWREAAVLYQKRLNRPRDAARCLEQGGLWIEAIALYEKLESYEKAGDLYLQLDQVDPAHEQFRKAVEQHRVANDRLTAARLLENKLDAVDEAIEELSSGWPDAPQAVSCLRGLFRMLGRIGRHEMAYDWVSGFREQPLPAKHRVTLSDILADAAVNYPDRTVQSAAADCTRAVVSRQLSDAPQPVRKTLLSAITRLVPDDRLLGRDCQRYLQPRSAQKTKVQPIAAPRPTGPQLIHRFELPGKGVRWSAATAVGRVILVAGQIADQLVVVRADWNAVDRPGKSWPLEPLMSESRIILGSDPWDAKFVLMHVVGDRNLMTEYEFKPSDRMPFTTKVGAIRGLSPDVIAADRTFHGITWLLEERGPVWVLVALGRDGEQISTEVVVPRADAGIDFWDRTLAYPIPLHARGDTVYIGFEKQLLICDQAKPMKSIEFGQRICSIAGSAPRTRTRIAVSFERGGTFFCDDGEGRETQSFANNLDSPVIGFNRGGFLIAAGDGRSEVYSTQNRRLELVGELHHSTREPIAVLSGPKIDQFGIVSATGAIAVYELP